MDVPERTRGDRRRLARLIAKESDAVQRDRLRSVLLVLQGRQALEVCVVARHPVVSDACHPSKRLGSLRE